MIITYASEENQQAILDLEQVIFNDMELAVYDELTVTEVQKAWQIAVRQSDKSRYHYSRAIVAKDNEGLVLGVLFGYPDTDEPILDEAVQNVLADKYSYHRWLFSDSEVFENEWYIDSIVVASYARGQGIGKALIAAASNHAQQEGHQLIGLNVDDSNPRAQKLYERSGFKAVGRLKIGAHVYTHMQKQL